VEEIQSTQYKVQNDESSLKTQNSKLKTLVVVVTSNRGLCGAYNINVFRETLKQISEATADFVTIGKKAREFVTRTGNNLIADYSDIFKDDPTAEQVKTISMSLRDLFLSEGYAEVKVIYSFYISAIAQKAVTRPFLPVSKDKLSGFLEEITGNFITPMTQTGEYKLEPSKKVIADAIVPLILDLMFYEMLLEAKASEHAARMVAMKNARESSATKAKELTLIYNKARQAGITKEISEIVSGVESMKDL
jgi:F-type H+-transporting ATPase subunit gamma